jgi:hypothetical protein
MVNLRPEMKNNPLFRNTEQKKEASEMLLNYIFKTALPSFFMHYKTNKYDKS